ncbi:hypothetical protein L2V44_14255, partial [Staphylococcus aureus]|nr:hypothetical protein [Staphylococcus aureus]
MCHDVTHPYGKLAVITSQLPVDLIELGVCAMQDQGCILISGLKSVDKLYARLMQVLDHLAKMSFSLKLPLIHMLPLAYHLVTTLSGCLQVSLY